MDASIINKESPPSPIQNQMIGHSKHDLRGFKTRLDGSEPSSIEFEAHDQVHFQSRNTGGYLQTDIKTAEEPSLPKPEPQNPLMQADDDRGKTDTDPAYDDSGYSGSETRNQIYTHLIQIINDRHRLQTELHYAESTIFELDAQNRELHRLLKSVQDALQSSDKRAPTQIHPRNLDLSHKANWIGGTWLSCAKTAPLLTAAEAAWQGGKPQQALALLTPILNEEDLKPSHRINVGLLYSAILRGNGDLQGALHHAEECLSIARETDQRQLTGKAQFHRGLCCLYLDRFADARWCFVLGSHTEGHAAIVQEYLVMTQQKLTELKVDDPRARFFSEIH